MRWHLFLLTHPHLAQVGLGDAADAQAVARALRGKVDDGSLDAALSERGLALQCTWRSRYLSSIIREFPVRRNGGRAHSGVNLIPASRRVLPHAIPWGGAE